MATGSRTRLARLLPDFDGIDSRPYYYVLPGVAVYAAFMLYPLVQAFLMSFKEFTSITGANEWVGIANYQQVLSDPLFWRSFANTFLYSIGLVILPIVLGLGLAVIVDSTDRGSVFFRTLIFSPVVTPIVVASLLFVWILNTEGILNSVLVATGVVGEGVSFLGTTTWAMPSVIAMTTWQRTGYFMVILLAGLQGIPDSVYEAARIHGKSRWKTFRYVTLPLLKPAILITVIIGIIDSFKAFAVVFIMTGGGPANSTEILGTYFYEVIFTNFEFGKGSAIGFILFVFSLLLSTLVLYLQSDGGEPT
jgi:ABC-type sugar transport system permease subunit